MKIGDGSTKVIIGKSQSQIRSHAVNFALVLGIFVMMIAWGFSSPPGSVPDEDFHAASIVCANGSNDFCEVLELDSAGNIIRANVPNQASKPCFFTEFPSDDASCISEQVGSVIETTRINIDHVSGLFYSVMNKFLGTDYDSSIRMMRIFNAFLFCSLLFLALTTVIPRIRRGIALMLMTAMVPFATFFIPSINPSSWAITGVVFSWVFLYSLVKSFWSPLNVVRITSLSLGLIASLILILGSRKDALIYLLVSAIATVILAWPGFNKLLKWLLVSLAAGGGILVWISQGPRLDGFTSIVSSNFFSPWKLIETTIELPSVVAGIIGSSVPILRTNSFFYYGIGWHEVQMPVSVILITLPTLGALVFTFLPRVNRRLLVAVGFVLAMMVVSQLYAVAAVGFSGYSNATPRYMTPLFLLAVVIFFSGVKIRRNFPSRGQTIWIFIAMPLASAIALLTTIRRYTNGQAEPWLELFFEPNWWWSDFPLGPTAVWLLGVSGSLVVAYASLQILREPRSEVSPTADRAQPVQEEATVALLETNHFRSPSIQSLGRSRIVFGFSWIFSLFSAWALLRLPGESNPAANLFRGYFPDDQLSYAGIAASAKAGNFGLVEPFTQTGVSFYPSWWYKFIGQFASWTGMEIPAAWSFLGFCVILGSIAFIGLAAYRISGRAWAPLVLGVLLWIGPLSSILFDTWFVKLDSHAVMWGPYGALYPLNAEAAGLSIGSVALVLGYWNLSRPEWSRNKKLILFGLSGLGLGIIANFQTYSFLTLTAVVFWVLAIAGLLSSRSRTAVTATAASLVVFLIAGALLRDVIGALPVYALMIVPSLLGIWLFAKDRISLICIGMFMFVVGAAPQIILMISGTLSADPFLTYRVDQSGELGVPIWAFLLIGSPVLITWVAILRAQILRNGVKEIALLIGWFIAFVLLAFNNVWGFGQEPYRFWIDSVIIFVVVATLTIPTAITSQALARRSSMALGALAVVLVGASVWNVGGFRSFVSEQGNIDFDSPRLKAIGTVVSSETLIPGGLVSAETCIDPRLLKVVTGAPVAFYNLGLAWPANKLQIDALIETNNAGVLDISRMRDAGVAYLITDTSCPTQWFPGGNPGVAQLSSLEYPTDQGNQRIELWRIL